MPEEAACTAWMCPSALPALTMLQARKPPTKMGFGKFIVEKHSKIVAVVLPASVAFGCLYTLEKGTNPFSDLRSWATGADSLSKKRAVACFCEPVHTYRNL